MVRCRERDFDQLIRHDQTDDRDRRPEDRSEHDRDDRNHHPAFRFVGVPAVLRGVGISIHGKLKVSLQFFLNLAVDSLVVVFAGR